MANQLIHFGKLSLLYEDGFIRYVKAGEIEILRKIFFALRDNNWATADIVRRDERISVTSKGFEIAYTATNTVDNKEVFRWYVKIAGNESGEIDFSVEGEALANYNRNRAGICVLHPIRETKDKVLKVTRPDGSVYENKFPSLINPHQPFLDIKKMKWQVNDNAWAELQFEGDIFEMEDQRNWSDTSFKTYSTPLSVPYPVMLNPGDKVNQRVKMIILNNESLPSVDLSEDIEVTINEGDERPFPKIGAGYAGVAVSKEVELLKSLHFEHLRIELILSDPGWKNKLKEGIGQAKEIGAKVFVHLVIDKFSEWDQFASEDIASISKIAISPLDRKANVAPLVQHVVPRARKLFPNVVVGAGYVSYFTELNRNRFDYSLVDFVIYPVSPQAHSTDSLTIIENLPAQKDAVWSAIHLAPGKKVHVGLVSIKSGFDPRHQTTLTAGWEIASIKYLSEGGADSITLFESHGRAGYFSEDHLFPVYHALLSLRKLDPKKVISSSCNEPLVISSLVVEDANSRRHLVLVNHTASKKFVTVDENLYTLAGNEIQFIPL